MSYTQSVKEGENPPPYTPAYENVLAKAGIFMHQHLSQAPISNTCQELCATLLDGEYELPEHSLFEDGMFWTTMESVRRRNEARVVRDITPLIVPSPELLYARRGILHLQHLTEEINAEWTKCICLAGPRPKPDYAIGFMSSAFTDDEVMKLKSYTAPERATLFTEYLYFPFIMCEVKCGENGLNIADRQNAHSASMAVNAIVQLHRAAAQACELHQENQGLPKPEELHGKILAFSISHDHTMVKIYGHYAVIEGDRTTFYRHLVHSFDLTAMGGREKATAYNFIRETYNTFVPPHFERIRNLIALLPEPRPESLPSVPSGAGGELGLTNSREIAVSAPSSQDTLPSKKSRLSVSTLLKQENERQRQQLVQEREENQRRLDRAREESERQRQQEREESERQRQQEREENQRRLDREKEESQRRLDREKEESEKRHTELMSLLKEQKAKQEEQTDRQKEQMDRQNKEIDDQKEQIKRLTEMLEQQISSKR